MPAALIPIVVQVGEALAVAILALTGAHQAGIDWHGSLTAGIAAFIGKLLPKQFLGAIAKK